MKVQHAEEAFGSSAGRYGGGATDTSAAIRVPCRRREDGGDGGTCCDRSAAAKTAATATINRSDTATTAARSAVSTMTVRTVRPNSDASENLAAGQDRGRKCNFIHSFMCHI
ncbi:unnamed protein product [Macrosiphum euphorbiae]|uniref:Uncharacterized protein n=1 Tax=Macrosiphum euphorbiae TaxID=13131 RepID=A0AAV0X2V4_9HEMI|nr:unnamed protein product [Macrosiphum euphorbiae]